MSSSPTGCSRPPLTSAKTRMSFHFDLSTLATFVSSLRMAFCGQFFTQMPQTLQPAVSSGLPSFISMPPNGQF